MEYNHLLDQALEMSDPMKRLAYVAIYSMTLLTGVERNSTKPFNPLLGETFEFISEGFRFLAEQVSHHPPITGCYCEGFSGYKVWTNSRAKTKFTGRALNVIPMYKTYVELTKYGETYEI